MEGNSIKVSWKEKESGDGNTNNSFKELLVVIKGSREMDLYLEDTESKDSLLV